MKYEHLLIDIEGPVATVTINRPEVHNALAERTWDELTDCFKQLGAAPKKARLPSAVRAIILRGAGRTFCAGADLRWMHQAAKYTRAKNKKDAYRIVRTIATIDECPVPVISRVHGGVYGGGLGLMAASDIVVAEDGARFCFSECRLGILPAVVTTFVLPKIGMSHTRRLYLTSEVFGTELAVRIGLVHEAAAGPEIDSKVGALVKNILRNGPEAVRLSKSYLRKMTALSHAARLRFSVDTLVSARTSPEGKEGFASFLEKRKPYWAADK